MSQLEINSITYVKEYIEKFKIILIFNSAGTRFISPFCLYKQFIFLILVSILSSCLGTRFLNEGEQLLYSQKLKGAKDLNKEEIENLYTNKPNTRVLFLPFTPQIEIYQRGLKRYEVAKYELKKTKTENKYLKKIKLNEGNPKKQKKYRGKLSKKIDKLDKIIKEGNFGMRNGEKLAVFDSTLEEETLNKIRSYLQANGYFNAEVKLDLDKEEIDRFVDVVYTIDKKAPYIIDSIYYDILDSSIYSFYHATQNSSLIQKGSIYTQNNLIDERTRINELMLNNGYYDFSRQYLSFDVDSTLLDNNRVTIGIHIKNPNNKNQHKIFNIDSVIFTTDSDITGVSGNRKQELYNHVNYQYFKKRYSKKLIDWRLFIYPDSLYSRENTFETQRQLSNLDIYKFINVNYDTTGGKFIANIFTSPLQKYQTSNEVGVNVSEGLPGPFVNLSFKDRNVFNGLEVMELNARVGFEGLGGVSNRGNEYSSLEYGGNVTFSFPQFLFPFGNQLKSRIGKLNPKTRLVYGLTFSDRPEYLRNNFNGSITYSWQKSQNKLYNFTLADISYIDSDLSDSFDQQLQTFERNGNNLFISFEPSFVSSTILSAVYNFNNYGNKTEKSAYFRYQLESGGNLISSLGSSIFGSSLRYFKFAKVNADYRVSRPLNSKISVAYRFNLGVAVPYGDNKTLPYEKFFFAGGSNSNRAWAPRRLGPGSYAPLDSLGNYANSFEQSGEILFESSVELRHKIIGFLYGGLFIDAGNTWTLRNDDSRPGSQFDFNRFYKEIAVGAGYGFRFDFSFLLLRFDAGFKIYDPSGGPNKQFIWDNGFDDPGYVNYKRLVWNIGIGYPF